MQEASRLLHEAAQPAGSPTTVHVSATSQAFTMQGGLDGDARAAALMTWADAIQPLRQRNFSWYFASRFVNTLGTMMATIALTFAVLDITDPATASDRCSPPTPFRWCCCSSGAVSSPTGSRERWCSSRPTSRRRSPRA